MTPGLSAPLPPRRSRLPWRLPVLTACLSALAMFLGPALRPETTVRASTGQAERVIDLAVRDGLTEVVGAPNKEQLGNDLDWGDLNADGKVDLWAGAHWWSTGGRNIIGRAYGLFGRALWPARLDLASAEQRGFSMTGRGLEARLGNAVAVGDLSGDGVDDAIAASLLADPPDPEDTVPPIRLLNNAGAIYIVFGGPALTGDVDFLDAEPDVYIAGDSDALGSDQLGTDLAVGDFNADGRPDLAASASLRGRFTGAVFGWFGPLAKGQRIGLSQQEADWIIEGDAERVFFGASLAVGDLDGDGRDDLVASQVDDDGESGGSGLIRVFSGGPAFGQGSRRKASEAEVTILPPGDQSIGSALSLGGCSCRGQVMAVGDLTGDGKDDLIAGAPLAEQRAGSVFLIAGPLAVGTIRLSQQPHLRLGAGLDDGRLGWSLGIGSLDGDGQADLLLAAPWADGPLGADIGQVLGLRGPLPANGVMDLTPATIALRAYGPHLQAGLAGISMALIDSDGDGAADLHLAFPDAAPMDRRSAGAIYRIAGPLLPSLATPTPSPTATPPASPTPPPTDSPEPTAPPTHTEPAVPSDTAEPGWTLTPEPSSTGVAPGSATVVSSPTGEGWTGRVWLPFLGRTRQVRR